MGLTIVEYVSDLLVIIRSSYTKYKMKIYIYIYIFFHRYVYHIDSLSKKGTEDQNKQNPT